MEGADNLQLSSSDDVAASAPSYPQSVMVVTGHRHQTGWPQQYVVVKHLDKTRQRELNGELRTG
ncbi:hypothetical protein Ancab_034820 [Ancistrocladus abbreviatus]